MNILPDSLSVSLSEIAIENKKKKNRSIPVLDVFISGKPSIGNISKMMANIREISSQIQGDYLAVTDLSKLEINDFFRSIIIYGMEQTYKTFVSVPHPATLSFVILGSDQRMNKLLTGSLSRINEDVANHDYAYRYLFVEKREQIREIAQKYLER